MYYCLISYSEKKYCNYTEIIFLLNLYKSNYYLLYEASRDAGAQSVTINATGCWFDPHSRKCHIYLNLYFNFFTLKSRQSAAFSITTRQPLPPEFGGKWEKKRLNTSLPLPAGYSVKLIFNLLLAHY